MNKNKCVIGVLGVALCSALAGCTTYRQRSAVVEVREPAPALEIRVESDFYEPLTPYGRWQTVGSYGRCWIPGRVEADWRPYSEGYWQRTDAGWYWVSYEPWGWATYHYGCWDLSPEYGWYWVPQTQWAPAWVSWHSGGGYIGWTPRYPAGVRESSPRGYVFVEERHFMEPVRRSTLVVNNTTIINQTVINQAPSTALVAKSTGREVQAFTVQELRHKTEATVVAQQRMPVATIEKKGQAPVRSEIQPTGRKAAVAPAPPQVEKSAPAAYRAEATAPNAPKAPASKAKPVLATTKPIPVVNPGARPEINPPSGKTAPTREGADKHHTKPATPEKPIANQNKEPNPTDNHENKTKD